MTRSNAKKRIIAELSNRKWNPTEIKNILDKIGHMGERECIEVEKVLNASSLAVGTPISDIKRKGNKRDNVMARGFCYLEFRKAGYTLTEIGHIFGKHHSTILAGLKSIKIDLSYDKELNNKYINFKERL